MPKFKVLAVEKLVMHYEPVIVEAETEDDAILKVEEQAREENLSYDTKSYWASSCQRVE